MNKSPRPGAGPPARRAKTTRGRSAPAWPSGSAARLRLTNTALDSISEGFFILDRDWRFVFVNPAAERFVSKSRAELFGRTLWEIFPEASDRLFGREYRRAVAEHVPVQFEEYYPEPLNAWYEVRAYPSPEGLSVFFRDVTARRRIEEALRQSEERYRSLFNSMAQGFALFDVIYDESGTPRESRFVDVNAAFETMTGLTRDDVVGRLGRDVFPDEYAKWADVYARVVQSGEPTAFRLSRSGADRHYEVFAYRPAPRQFAVLFHDVTEHKKLEEELRVNLTKYSVLFDSIPLGISVTDSEGNVREINRTASRVLGTRPEAVVGQRIGRPDWRVIRPDGSVMPPEEFASVRAMKEQDIVEGVEVGVSRPGEEVIWVSVSAAPIPLDGYGVVITYGDITRRRQAEERLEAAHREAVAANARFEATMEALPIGLAIADAVGGILQSNAAFDRIWGPGRPRTKSVADYHTYKARWVDTGREVLPEEWASSRAVQRGEMVVGQLLEIDRFDGGRAFVLNSAAPILDEGGAPAGCAVAVQDISHMVETERALERSEKALRIANAILEATNAGLRLSNETLEARVAERTADLAKRASQIEALALDRTRAEERERQKVARVIHDNLQQLLSLARINLGIALLQVKGRAVAKNLVELDGLIAESLDITRSITSELSPGIVQRGTLGTALRWLGRWFENRFGLDVAVDADEEIDATEEVRVTMFRAARELLFNVVKHAGVPTAGLRLRLTDDGRMEIAVRDEGAGFDPGILRAWDGARGSFGLFSLREHLELFGGRLEVESAPGRGTTATIVGPVVRAPEAETPAPAGAPKKTSRRARRPIA